MFSSFAITFSVLFATVVPASNFKSWPIEETCPRIRKNWLTMTQDERNLYIEGILALRDPDIYATVAKCHETAAYVGVIHQSSLNIPWHSYLAWEIESRIRALGDKWECFGLPYYDYTMEIGHETDMLIFHTGIGGPGDPDNAYTVNWKPTSEWWVPYESELGCSAKGDEYPYCSLKRGYDSTYRIKKAKQTGKFFEANKWSVFADSYQNKMDFVQSMFHSAFIEDIDEEGGGIFISFDPMWFLYHSFVELHHGMWIDCHNYNEIDPLELQHFPNAYESFCLLNENPLCTAKDGEISWDLDAPIDVCESLKQSQWSFIAQQPLTMRKMFDVRSWNIKYDLGDGTGWWVDSGLSEWCADNLNSGLFFFSNSVNKDQKTMIVVDTENNEKNGGIISNNNNNIFKDTFFSFMQSTVFLWFLLLSVIFWLPIVTIHIFRRDDSKPDSAYSKLKTMYGSV